MLIARCNFRTRISSRGADCRESRCKIGQRTCSQSTSPHTRRRQTDHPCSVTRQNWRKHTRHSSSVGSNCRPDWKDATSHAALGYLARESTVWSNSPADELFVLAPCSRREKHV